MLLRRLMTPAIALTTLVACHGGARPATTPAPAQAPSPNFTAARPSTPITSSLPPAPVVDTLRSSSLPASAELALLGRQDADSAKDDLLLRRIASDTGAAVGGPLNASPALPLTGAEGVKWDIDVTSYADNGRVQYWLDFFQGYARDRFGIWLERLARYEPLVRARLQAEKLPTDFVYLALIESGFSNQAVSRSRAVGMWQFMRGTARDYDLKIDGWVDERRDPIKATDAAARHLEMLYSRFGSVYLAAAAYNAGGGKISRTLNRLDIEPEEDDDGSKGFSDEHFFRLYDTKFIRQETKDYVPKLIAAALIAKQPARYGFTVPAGIAPFSADSIIVPDMTGFDVLARVADTTVAAMRELNPQFLRLSTPPGRSVVVRVPAGHGDRARVAYAALSPSDRVTFAAHDAAKGETLARIAQHYGVTLAFLREANPGVGTGRLKAGTQVLVPQGGELSVAVTRELAAASSPQVHRVRRGETLGRVARRYGVTVAELRAWNGLGRKVTRVAAGRRLRVTEPDATNFASRGRKSRVATTGKTGAATKPAAKVAVVRHVVKPGETLTSVAKRYGVTIADIQSLNHLGQKRTIKSGTALRIPT